MDKVENFQNQWNYRYLMHLDTTKMVRVWIEHVNGNATNKKELRKNSRVSIFNSNHPEKEYLFELRITMDKKQRNSNCREEVADYELTFLFFFLLLSLGFVRFGFASFGSHCSPMKSVELVMFRKFITLSWTEITKRQYLNSSNKQNPSACELGESPSLIELAQLVN